MKKASRKSLALLIASIGGFLLLAPPAVQAANVSWDGGIVDLVGNGNGLSAGGAGTWDTTIKNWDFGNVPYAAWVNANNDTAVFGGTAGTVTLGSNIAVGGMLFNTTGYTLAAGTNGLNFGATNNSILINNVAAATITGTVGGVGSVILTSSNTAVAGNLTFSGTSTGGWSGSTTVNAGTTLTTTSATGSINQVLNNTSGILLNGGTIQFNTFGITNINAINDSANITSKGGTFSVTSADAGNAAAIETLGSVDLAAGQLNFVYTNNASSGRTITFSGLTRSGTVSAVSFSSGNFSTNNYIVTGSGTTTTGQIIAPWATTGTVANAQTDYAVYTANVISPAGIAASAETTWTTSTNAYTLSIAAKAASALTATREIAALKVSSTVSNLTSATTSGSANFALTGHTFAVGDPVVLGGTAPGGFSTGVVYYVQSIVAGTSFTLAATPGGAAINATSATTPNVTGGLKLDSGINLGTTGILNSGSAPIGIGRAAAGGQLTLPAAGAGSLYVTPGSGTISIDAPIVDNSGALTLVKNGSGNLFLTGANTYTGGTVLNSGTLLTTADVQLGTGGGVIINGVATWNMGGTSSLSYSRTVTVNDGAVFNFASGNALKTITGKVSGGGAIINTATTTLAMTNTANDFTGSLNTGYETQVANIGDSSNPINIGGATNGFTWVGSTGAKTLASRVFTLNTTGNNQINASGATTSDTLTILQSPAFSGAAGARTLTLGGSNTGLNVFAGSIADGVGSVISMTKAGAGRWALAGTNTYSGTTINNFNNPANAGLVFQGIQALSPNTTLQQTHAGGTGGFGVISLLDDAVSPASRSTVNLNMIASNSSHSMTLFVGNNNTANGGSSSSTTTGSTITLGNLNFSQTAAGNTSQTLAVTGANSYRLQLNNVNLPALVASSTTWTGTLNPTSAPLTIAGNVRQTAGSLAGTMTLTLNGTAIDNLISGSIQDSADVTSRPLALSKNSAATWVLSGTNTFTGATSNTSGILQYAKLVSMPSTSTLTTTASTLAVNVGGVGEWTTGTSGAGTIGGLLSGVGGQGNTLAWSGSSTLGLDTTNASGTLTYSGVIGDVGTSLAIRKQGTNTLVFDQTNTYTGTTTVAGGRLVMANTQAFGTGANARIVMSGGGIADIATDGGDTAYNSTIGTGATGTLVSNRATAGAGINHTLGAMIIGGNATLGASQLNVTTGSAVTSGAGSITLASVTLSAGAITSPNYSTLNPTTANLLVGTVTAANTTTGTKTLNLDGTSSGNAVTGAITNGSGGTAVALLKTNSSSWVLSGTNTYSGATTVNAGKLRVDGTGSINNSTVTINGATANLAYNSSTNYTNTLTFTQGTLSGTNWNGSLSGLTIDTNKRISPGNSPGTANSVVQTWAGGGSYQWEINNATGTVGADPGWDLLNLSGGLTQTANSGSKFTIDITGLNVSNVAGLVSNWNSGANSTFVIASAAGGITGFDASGYTLNVANFTNNNSSPGNWSIFQGNGTNGGTINDIVLGYTASGGSPNFVFTNTSDVMLNVLRNGTGIITTKTIQNTGSATGNASLANTNSNLGVSGILTNIAASASELQTLSPTNTSTSGTSSGTLTVTLNSGGSNVVNTTVVVGNAGFDGTNSSTTFGTPLSTLVAATANLPSANFESNSINATVTGGGPIKVGTTATIVRYDNSSGGAETVSMAWRSRTAAEADLVNNPKALLSDVVRISGMGPANTDVGSFLLEMTYDLTQPQFAGLNENAIALSGELQLAWFNPNTNQWTNAVDGNFGGTAAFAGIGVPTGSTPLGTWGIATGGNNDGIGYVWAVLNHNSDFAVIPEPNTLVLGGLALLGFIGVGLRRRRNQQHAS